MSSDKNFIVKSKEEESILWFDVLDEKRFKIYGLNWLNQPSGFNRLPESKKDLLLEVCPNVYNLASNTAGVQAHFFTNSKKIIIDVEVDSEQNLSGMTPLARAGFDLYVGKSFKEVKFFGGSGFNPTDKLYQHSFINYYDEEVLCLLNFPLYTGVKKLKIGIEEKAMLRSSNTFDKLKRVICYGTSITQGGCASRPGLNYTNILSRRLGVEWLNFGFSGNAFGESELIDILAQIDNASLFIIDYEANSGTNGKLKKTLRSMIEVIRKHQPDIKIMVISRIPYLFDEIVQSFKEVRTDLREFQEKLIKELQDMGDKNLYYVNGSKLLGEDYHEYTVDTVHPNDLGFMKFSDSIGKIINSIINTGENNE